MKEIKKKGEKKEIEELKGRIERENEMIKKEEKRINI